MIYDLPNADAAIDQGDLIDQCPIAQVNAVNGGQPQVQPVGIVNSLVLVLTQTCDLANTKTTLANIAEVFEAQTLVDAGMLKVADIRGPIRAGRVWGWYSLPASADLGLAEMIVDFHRLHTVEIDLLRTLCKTGKRRGRIQPLYREHRAKHFADTFSRIGLPRPYETM